MWLKTKTLQTYYKSHPYKIMTFLFTSLPGDIFRTDRIFKPRLTKTFLIVILTILLYGHFSNFSQISLFVFKKKKKKKVKLVWTSFFISCITHAGHGNIHSNQNATIKPMRWKKTLPVTIVTSVPWERERDHHREILRYGNTFPSNLSWSPIGSHHSKWLANCHEVCKSHANTNKLRGSIKCGERHNYVSI